jgi:hypothetical protein
MCRMFAFRPGVEAAALRIDLVCARPLHVNVASLQTGIHKDAIFLRITAFSL